MNIFEDDTLLVKDRNGGLREVYRLGFEERRRFRRLQKLLIKRLEGVSPDEIDKIYDSDEVFVYALHGCVECFGLDSDAFSLSQLVSLVVFKVVDGEQASPILIDLEFPSLKKSGKILDPDTDPDLHALAVAWAESGSTLDDILGALGKPKLSFSDVLQVTSIRSQLIEEAIEKSKKKTDGKGNPMDDLSEDEARQMLDAARKDIQSTFGIQKPLTEDEMIALGLK